MIQKFIQIEGARVLVTGFAFQETCPDMLILERSMQKPKLQTILINSFCQMLLV